MTPRERAWLRRWIDAHADPNADADAQRDLIRARAIVDRAEGEAERIREAVARAYEVVPAAAPVASAERAVVEAAVEWRACLSAKRATGSVLCPPGKSCGAALESAVDALAAARKGGRK